MEDRITVAMLKTNKENTYIEVELYFNRSTYSYWTGTTLKKGYYVSVQPEKRTNGMVEFMAFTGYKAIVEESNRFNQKKFNSLKDSALDSAKSIIDRVLREQGLSLVD